MRISFLAHHHVQGVQKGFLPKGEQTDNYWTFVAGSKVEALPPPR